MRRQTLLFALIGWLGAASHAWAAIDDICTPLPGEPKADPVRDLCDVQEKPGSFPPWGDIFGRFFSRTELVRSHALVIAVGDYDAWQNLEAPLADARRVRDFLVHDEGFDLVVTLTNRMATKGRIERLMEEVFPSRVTPRDRFLFYFSGHGTQRQLDVGKVGYLVLKVAGERSFADMVSMGNIQRWADNLSHARHTLFLLDACFSGLAGTQRMGPLDDKTIDRLSQYGHHLVTAGTENEESVGVSGGSVFTTAFLRAASGLGDTSTGDYPQDGIVSLKEMTEYIGRYLDAELARINARFGRGYHMTPQLSELRPDNAGEFFFISRARKIEEAGLPHDTPLVHGVPEGKGSTAIGSEPYQNRDAAMFATIRDSMVADDFERFIQTYPSSVLVPDAEHRLAALRQHTPAPEPEPNVTLKPDQEPRPAQELAPTLLGPEAIEQALGLSRDQRRDIQLALNELRHDVGAVDGSFGPRTRGAIKSWQRELGALATGYLTGEQVAQLVPVAARIRQRLAEKREAEEQAKRREAEELAKQLEALRMELAKHPEAAAGLAKRRALDEELAKQREGEEGAKLPETGEPNVGAYEILTR
jgi:hypothetical protein